MQALLVVPVDPAERRQFEVVDRAPGTTPWTAHQLGLVEGVHALGECIVERLTGQSGLRPVDKSLLPTGYLVPVGRRRRRSCSSWRRTRSSIASTASRRCWTSLTTPDSVRGARPR